MKKIILNTSFYNGKLVLKAKFSTGFIFVIGECDLNGNGYLIFTFKLPNLLSNETVQETLFISLEEFSSINESKIYSLYKQAKQQWITKNPLSAGIMINYHNEKANKWKSV